MISAKKLFLVAIFLFLIGLILVIASDSGIGDSFATHPAVNSTEVNSTVNSTEVNSTANSTEVKAGGSGGYGSDILLLTGLISVTGGLISAIAGLIKSITDLIKSIKSKG